MILNFFIKKIKKKRDFRSKNGYNFFSDLFWLKRMISSLSATSKILITVEKFRLRENQKSGHEKHEVASGLLTIPYGSGLTFF